MGRAPCCEKIGMKKGRWTAEEDELLTKYIAVHGEGSWRSLPKNAGLLRCGKSCRLRWINYLRSDLKRGNITPEEEDAIIKLHSSLGNRWSDIAGHFPGRTDNEIKNYWNSHLSRRIHIFDDSSGEKRIEVDLGRVSSSRRLRKSAPTRKEENVRDKLDERVLHDKLSTQSKGGAESTVIDSDPQQQASSANFAVQKDHDMVALMMGELEDPCVGLLSATSLVAESELWSTTTASKGREVVNEEGGERKGEGDGDKVAAAALNGDTNEGEVVKWLDDLEILDRQCKLWDDGSNMGGEPMWPWADQEGSSTATGYQLEEGTVDSWLSDVL